jgi:GntR family transcriptional regulator
MLGTVKKSPPQWNEDQPIYRQLMERLIARILDGTYPEGEMLPSVRQLASDCEVNPLTAAKAYKELARDGLIDRLRGEGLIVAKGSRDALLRRERSRFLKAEWPNLRARLRRLGIDVRALPDLAEEK